MRKYIPAIMAIMLAAVIVIAGEITANFTLKVTKGKLDIQRTLVGSFDLTNATPNVAGLTQNIATNLGGTAITLGDVTTNGVAWFKNLDTNTNYYVEIGVTNGGSFAPLIRLNAGEAWPVRLAQGITPYARATCTGAVASVVIEKLIFDN